MALEFVNKCYILYLVNFDFLRGNNEKNHIDIDHNLHVFDDACFHG